MIVVKFRLFFGIVAKRVLEARRVGYLYTQQTNHIRSPAALETEALPVGPVLLHEPLDVVLRQRRRLLPPADVRGRTHGLHIPISAANVDDRFYLRRSLDVVLDLLSSIRVGRLLRS